MAEEEEEARINSFTYEGKQYFINHLLANALVSIAYNLKKDWDFVILVTGDRKVRVGKSVLAMTICAFLACLLKIIRTDDKVLNKNAFGSENIFFDNKLMIAAAQKLPPYSVLQYDEAREGLAASKSMKQFQQDLIDFFTECGQLNHVFVVVCPDFFELKEDIAVGRSEMLINVYRKEKAKYMDVLRTGFKIPVTVLQRGYFEFFDRNRKSYLYDKAKSTRRKSYSGVKCLFTGTFTNQYTIDEETYKLMKKDSLARFNDRHKEELEGNTSKKTLKSALYRLEYDLNNSNMKKTDDVMYKKYGIKVGERYGYELLQHSEKKAELLANVQ